MWRCQIGRCLSEGHCVSNHVTCVSFRSNSWHSWSVWREYDVIHITHTWQLRTHKLFSVQHTIHSVDVKQIYPGCGRGNFSIRNIMASSSTLHTFCGKYDFVKVYTGPNSDMEVAHFHLIPTSLHVSFTIATGETLQTRKWNHTTSSHLFTTLDVILLNRTLFTFVVQVAKYYRACVRVVGHVGKSQQGTAFVLVDGPGFLSEHWALNQQSLNSGVCFSSHQFIMQVYSCFSAWYEESIATSTAIPDITETFVPKNGNKLHIFSNSHSNGKTQFQSIKVESKTGQHLNITVLSALYFGSEMFLCNYGGIAFFDQWNNTLSESALVCSNKTHGSHRNVYSSGKIMFVIAYSYNKYSSFTVSLQMSVTKCKSTRLNTCKFLSICQEDNIACRNLHEASGFKAQKYSFQHKHFDTLQLAYDVEDGQCKVFQLGNTLWFGPCFPTQASELGKLCKGYLYPIISSQMKVLQHTVQGMVKSTGLDECLSFPNFKWVGSFHISFLFGLNKRLFDVKFPTKQQQMTSVFFRLNVLSENWIDITVTAKHDNETSNVKHPLNRAFDRIPVRSVSPGSIFALELGEKELSLCYGPRPSDTPVIDMEVKIRYFGHYWKVKSNFSLSCSEPLKYIALKNSYVSLGGSINTISAIKYRKDSNRTATACWMPWMMDTAVSNSLSAAHCGVRV